jgi:hypothetical protein
MSKERPILFSGAMVRAILDGSKTQTRRIVKVRGLDFIGGKGQENDPAAWGYPYPDREGYADLTDGIACPYGKPGDRLWVRETWGISARVSTDGNERRLREQDLTHLLYRATADHDSDRWRPSIHMPRWASRTTLEVESVRVERLQDISEEDAKAEGVMWYQDMSNAEVFQTLWESINGPGSWDANPWVWVITFKRIKP